MKILLALFLLVTSFNAGFGNNDSINSNENAIPGEDSLKVIYFLNKADKIQVNDPGQAEKLIDQVIEIAFLKNSPFYLASLARCYNQKGIVKTIQGDYVKAINNYQAALQVYEKLHTRDAHHKDYREGKANILANIGTIYYHKENFTKAIEYWEMSIAEISQLNNPAAEAQLLNNIGVVYMELEEKERALEYYNKALDLFTAEGDEKNIAMCYTNIAEVYGQMGFYSKALELLEKSRIIKEKSDDKLGLLQCMLAMANLCFDMKEYPKTIEFATQTLNLSTQLNAKKDILRSYQLLSKANAALGDFKNAYEMQVLLKQMNDSIFNEESRNRFDEIQARFENEMKENEMEILRQNENHQRTIKKIMIAGMIIIAVISALLIGSIIAKRRKEKALYTKDKLLLEQEKQLVNFELEKKELLTGELNQEIEFKTRQLTTHALNIMQKNKMLYEMLKSIDAAIKTVGNETKVELKNLKMQVKRNLKTDKDWEVFKLYFEHLNKDFFQNLLKITPELNIHDLRHCALIRLNLNIKETASVLNVSPNSIKSARYRLKKKLQLDPEDDLFAFLRKI